MKLKRDIFGFFLSIILKVLFFTSFIKLSGLCKISFILGSKFATFSGTSISIPLAGLFAGSWISLIYCISSLVVRYLVFGFSSWYVFAFYLPGLCAALCFSSSKFLDICMRLILPIVCILLFILHPVGLQAFTYSFFWIIPILVYVTKTKHMFARALASTFVAHAVGSIIFLYTLELNAVLWNGLIPIVALERFLMALVMFAVYKIVVFVKESIFLRRFGYNFGVRVAR